MNEKDFKKFLDIGAGALLAAKGFEKPVMFLEGTSKMGPYSIIVVTGEESCDAIRVIGEKLCPKGPTVNTPIHDEEGLKGFIERLAEDTPQ